MAPKRFARWSFTCALVGLALLGSAREAAAQRGILGWLDRLSGPGEFAAVGGEFGLRCFGSDPLHPDRPAWFDLDPACRSADRTRPRASLVVEISYFFDGSNPLQYRDAAGRPREGADVGGWRVIPAIDISIGRVLDVGAGFGVVWFRGDDFDTFARAAFQPFRVTVKPLAGRSQAQRPRGEWLQLRASLLHMGKFSADDFGAVAGSWGTWRNEAQLQAAVIIDLGLLFAHR